MTKKVKSKNSSPKALRPGELDGLVITYLRKHKSDGPHTASSIAKEMNRSSGAVANCLARLAESKQVRQATQKPRAYVIKEAGKR